MNILVVLLLPLQLINDWTGRIGKCLSLVAMVLMVVAILIQVFFRYVLNNALPWPDEAARFMMLWLTGMMGPVAMRQGGIVAITFLQDSLPGKLSELLALILLCMSMLVLSVAVKLGYNHVNSGWLFASASLKIPLQLIGMKAVKVKLAWMYASLFVGVCLMWLVNLELILRSLISLSGSGDDLRPIPVSGGGDE